MIIVRTIDEARSWRREAGAARTALVPTMGALHEGHLSLMRQARASADQVAVSLFVNPKQFGPQEDLARYPRSFESDRQACAAEGVDCLFYPSPEEIHPAGFRTLVEVEEWSGVLEGKSRPTHFRGVTTVVLKLFNILTPDLAVFGWKDAQQFLILRRMVRDLDLPVEMQAGETVREPDGVALSSRNRHLSQQQRAEAPVLYRSLQLARELVLEQGVTNSEAVLDQLRRLIEAESSAVIDGLDLVSLETLKPLSEIKAGDTLIALAAYFGATRLIDNLRL